MRREGKGKGIIEGRTEDARKTGKGERKKEKRRRREGTGKDIIRESRQNRRWRKEKGR